MLQLKSQVWGSICAYGVGLIDCDVGLYQCYFLREKLLGRLQQRQSARGRHEDITLSGCDKVKRGRIVCEGY